MTKLSEQTLQTLWQLTPASEPPPSITACAGRYLLLLNEACPLSHSCFLIWQQKQLSKIVSIVYVEPIFSGDWLIKNTPQLKAYKLSQLHGLQGPLLPLLFDTQENIVVCQNPFAIMQILNSEFNSLNNNDIDFYPSELSQEIAEQQLDIEQLRVAIFQAGCTTTQSQYQNAYKTVFAKLQAFDKRLEQQRFLLGKQLTACDWQLFCLLIRFDTVFHSVFFLNQQYIEDFQQLPNYLRELFQLPGVSHSCNFSAMRQHFYRAKGMDVIGLSPNINYFSDVYRPVW